MKPLDLKPPFPKTERKIVIHDHVWYVPNTHLAKNSFDFPGWDHQDLFGNTHPVHIEYCSGNGAWIEEQALTHPDINWVAIERKFTRVRKIWSKIKNHNLKNLLVICGEGHSVTNSYFPEASAANIYINFPDPWPKKRHAKNRLIQPDFVNELARILQSGKMVTFVTDDPDYSQQVIEIFLANQRFGSLYPHPHFSTEEQNYGNSFFDDLWRSKGKSIRYHRFIKS